MNSVAIDYIPPDHNNDGHIIGIDVAVSTFLDAYLRYSRAETLYCRTHEHGAFDRFQNRMIEIGFCRRSIFFGISVSKFNDGKRLKRVFVFSTFFLDFSIEMQCWGLEVRFSTV